jgi:hypothetical protein
MSFVDKLVKLCGTGNLTFFRLPLASFAYGSDTVRIFRFSFQDMNTRGSLWPHRRVLPNPA